MQLQKGQTITTEITKLAFGGRGIGQLDDGRKVFVEGAIPGDKIECTLTKIKKNYAEADLVRIVAPAKNRIDAKCKHFDRCGGCKWQMLEYKDQLKYKEDQVREALAHTGGLADSADLVKPIIGCDYPWLYRNKMEFSFGNESKDDAEVRVGLHPAGRRVDVFDVEECFIGSEIAAEILLRVRTFVRDHKLSFYNHKTDTGLLSSLFIREGKNTGEIMINLVTCSSEFKHKKEFVELFQDLPEVTSIYWTAIKRKRGVPTQHYENLLYGKPTMEEELKRPDGTSLKFKISPLSFFQPNTKQAEVLYAEVLKAAELTGEQNVFDLYCGTGTIGLFCSNNAKMVYGIELNESAVKNAKQNMILNGIENAWFKAGNVDAKLYDIPAVPDVVIVDPPRSGLGEKVVEKVCGFDPKKIVYVSCDPVNLARDIKFFAERGYKLSYVQPVDMFPHTYHIENVALLVR